MHISHEMNIPWVSHCLNHIQFRFNDMTSLSPAEDATSSSACHHLPGRSASKPWYRQQWMKWIQKMLQHYGMFVLPSMKSPWFCWVSDGFWMDLVGFLIDRVWILHGLGWLGLVSVRFCMGFAFLKVFLESVWTRSEHEFFGNTKSKSSLLTFRERNGVCKKSFHYCHVGSTIGHVLWTWLFWQY